MAGSLLGNSFVAGRMTVAAANQNWLPEYLGLIGTIGIPRRSDSEEEEEIAEPLIGHHPNTSKDEGIGGDAPM